MNQIDDNPEFTSFLDDMCHKEGSVAALFAIFFCISFFVIGKKIYDQTPHDRALVNGREPDDPFVARIHHIFVAPFLPENFNTLVVFVFFMWFCVTITMGITRFYKGHWSQEFVAQQGPFNVIANYFGCKELNVTIIDYDISNLVSEDLVNERDFLFRNHLVAGTLWLTLGCIQIYRAYSGWSTDDKIQKKMHRIFGWFLALPALFLHLYCSSRIAYNNPVNQTFTIRVQYFFIIFDNAVLAINGVLCMRKARAMQAARGINPETQEERELRDKHKIHMGFCYFDSIFGSGPIRVTAWILWLLAKFLPHHLAFRVDRSVCQGEKAGGDASNCQMAVFVNLAFGHILIIWIQWIFISLPSIRVTDVELKMLEGRFKSAVLFSIFIIPAMVAMVLFPRLEELFITSGVEATLQIIYALLFRTVSITLLAANPIKTGYQYGKNGNGWIVRIQRFIQWLYTGKTFEVDISANGKKKKGKKRR